MQRHRSSEEGEVTKREQWEADILEFLRSFLANSSANQRVHRLLREGEALASEQAEEE